MSPTLLLTSVVVLAAIALLAAIVRHFLHKHKLSGYAEIASEVDEIVKAIKQATLSREDDNLVIRGAYQSWPVVVRFSRSDNLPGISLSMQVPSDFTLFVSSRKNTAARGRALLRTTDAFDAAFAVRTDHPAEARMFIASTLEQCQKLCTSASSSLLMAGGSLEVNDAMIPPDPDSYVLTQLRGMAQLAAQAEKMPGQKRQAVALARRGFPPALKLASVAGVVIAVVLVTSLVFRSEKTTQAPALIQKPGIPEADALRIRDLEPWRLAQPADFDPQAALWMDPSGAGAMGRIQGNFGSEAAVAYVLVAENPTQQQQRRIVILADGQTRYDTELPQIAAAARISQSNLASVSWQGMAPKGEPTGDGLLIVGTMADGASGLVIFPSGLQLLSGIPVNYREITVN